MVTGTSKVHLFEEAMLPHLDAAYNLARWLTRNEQDAQDVAQEAFLRAFRFWDSFHGGDGKAWLMEVVRNTCFSWHRREKRHEHNDEFDERTHSFVRESRTAEDAMVATENRGTLRKCIDKLPDMFREVIVMRELEEMSYQQIGKVTGLASGTVMSRLSRARKRLDECVNGRRREAGK